MRPDGAGARSGTHYANAAAAVPAADRRAGRAGGLVLRRAAARAAPLAADLTGFSLAGIVIYGIGGIAKTTLAAEVTIWVLGRERGRVLISLTGTLTLESLPGAVISAIRRGQQLLRVVTGHQG